MGELDKRALDRHITGNYGEDQFKDQPEGDGYYPLPKELEKPWQQIKGEAGIEQINERLVDFSICPKCQKKIYLTKGGPRKVKCPYCPCVYHINKVKK